MTEQIDVEANDPHLMDAASEQERLLFRATSHLRQFQ